MNIASDVTLTITGTVSGGNFNVHGRLNVYVTGVLNINLGGTLVDSGTVYVNGLLNINSGGTLNVNSGAVNINSGGTLNVGGKVENFYGIQIAKGGVLRINDSGRFHNNGDTGSTVIYGTLNINNDAELDNDGGIKLYNEGILKVFTGGVLNNDGILFKHCSSTFTLNPGASYTGNPITGNACIAINDVSLAEGNSGTKNFGFKITRSVGRTGTTTVNYATVAGTATAGADYNTKSGTLTFTSGQTSKTVNIVVKGDTTEEPNERFSVRLSNCSNSCGIVDSKGIGTIKNDDG